MVIKNCDSCSTDVLWALDGQLIAELSSLAKFTRFDDEPLIKLTSKAVHPWLTKPAAEALKRAVRKRNVQLTINSGYRTLAQQALLYQNQSTCGILAAYPGKSNHQSGNAIDIAEPNEWKRALEAEGWNWLGDDIAREYMHFDFDDGPDMRSVSVLAFQKLANRNGYALSEDGELGQKTFTALVNAPIDGYEKSSFARVLRVGAIGEDVKQLQTLLGLMPDGRFGPATENAVRKNQVATGQTVTGTWRLLKP